MRRLGLLAATMALAMLGAAAPAAAAVEDNESITLSDFGVSVPCANGGAGDTVTLNGRVHVLLTFTINQNRVSGTEDFQPQDLSGTDTEGRAYHAVGGFFHSSFSGSLVDGQGTEIFVNRFYIVGTGGAPSYKVHETFDITVNAQGDVTLIQEHLRITCS
jgi:hypothetical protein